MTTSRIEKSTTRNALAQKRKNFGYAATLSGILLTGCETNLKQQHHISQGELQIENSDYISPLAHISDQELEKKSVHELRSLLRQVRNEISKAKKSEKGVQDRTILINIIAQKELEEDSGKTSISTKKIVSKTSKPKINEKTYINKEPNTLIKNYDSPLNYIGNLEYGTIDELTGILSEITIALGDCTKTPENTQLGKQDYIKVMDLLDKKMPEHYKKKLRETLHIHDDKKISTILETAQQLGGDNKWTILNLAILHLSGDHSRDTYIDNNKASQHLIDFMKHL